jgi:hypothetical protein
LKTLTKYVLVTASGAWLDMDAHYAPIRQAHARTPGTHVEQWTFRELADGTHDLPVKRVYPTPERTQP